MHFTPARENMRRETTGVFIDKAGAGTLKFFERFLTFRASLARSLYASRMLLGSRNEKSSYKGKHSCMRNHGNKKGKYYPAELMISSLFPDKVFPRFHSTAVQKRIHASVKEI